MPWLPPLYITINTFYTNFTALKRPYLTFEIFNTFEYQKLDRHLQAGLPVWGLYLFNLVYSWIFKFQTIPFRSIWMSPNHFLKNLVSTRHVTLTSYSFLLLAFRLKMQIFESNCYQDLLNENFDLPLNLALRSIFTNLI